MYQIGDLYNTDLTKKADRPLTNVHLFHQHRDQITGVERKKSIARKKKRNIIERVNINMRNRKVAALAKTFLENNKPIQASI